MTNKKQNSKPLVVEFFGLPGAGKTFVQSAMLEDLKTTSLNVCTRADMFSFYNQKNKLYKVKAVLRKPCFYLRFLCAFVFSSSLTLFLNSTARKRIKYAINYPLYINLYIMTVKPDILFLDRASIQNYWSLWFGRKKPSYNLLMKLIKMTNSIVETKYVFCMIDAETASERIIARPHGRSRFDTINNPNTVHYMLEKEAYFMPTLYNALECQNIKTIKINGQAKKEATIKELKNWMFQ